MQEYTKECYSLVNRSEAVEGEGDDKLVARHLLGLCADVQ